MQQVSMLVLEACQRAVLLYTSMWLLVYVLHLEWAVTMDMLPIVAVLILQLGKNGFKAFPQHEVFLNYLLNYILNNYDIFVSAAR